MPTPANSLNISATGLQSFDGTATFNGRTITPGNTSITISNGNGVSGNPTISASTSGGMVWNDATTTPIAMANNNGYTADDGGSEITFTLPTNSALGDIVEVQGKGSGLYTITYTTSQNIIFGKTTSTTTTGNVTSNLASDCIQLRCVSASITAPIFEVVRSQGTFSVT